MDNNQKGWLLSLEHEIHGRAYLGDGLFGGTRFEPTEGQKNEEVFEYGYGIYFLLLQGSCVYIGKTEISFRERICGGPDTLSSGHGDKIFDSVTVYNWRNQDAPISIDKAERFLIQSYQPYYNKQLRGDGKIKVRFTERDKQRRIRVYSMLDGIKDADARNSSLANLF